MFEAEQNTQKFWTHCAYIITRTEIGSKNFQLIEVNKIQVVIKWTEIVLKPWKIWKDHKIEFEKNDLRDII